MLCLWVDWLNSRPKKPTPLLQLPLPQTNENNPKTKGWETTVWQSDVFQSLEVLLCNSIHAVLVCSFISELSNYNFKQERSYTEERKT